MNEGPKATHLVQKGVVFAPSEIQGTQKQMALGIDHTKWADAMAAKESGVYRSNKIVGAVAVASCVGGCVGCCCAHKEVLGGVACLAGCAAGCKAVGSEVKRLISKTFLPFLNGFNLDSWRDSTKREWRPCAPPKPGELMQCPAPVEPRLPQETLRAAEAIRPPSPARSAPTASQQDRAVSSSLGTNRKKRPNLPQNIEWLRLRRGHNSEGLRPTRRPQRMKKPLMIPSSSVCLPSSLQARLAGPLGSLSELRSLWPFP